jgi:hypothetical protein
MTTQRQDMEKAIEEATIRLAHLRRCSKVEASQAVAATYAENLRLSRTTTMEPYWRLMVDVAEQQVGSALGESGR